MKNSMRLVVKMKLWRATGMVFIALLVVFGFGLTITLAREHDSMIAGSRLLSVGCIASFLGVLLALAFAVRFSSERQDAWRDYVRRQGASVADLMEKMHGAPSGGEVYTFEQAHALMTVCMGFRSLVPPTSPSFKDLQVLERKGWVRLTFSDPKSEGGGDRVITQLTEQAWAAVDELCPRNWSPEDVATPRLASYI